MVHVVDQDQIIQHFEDSVKEKQEPIVWDLRSGFTKFFKNIYWFTFEIRFHEIFLKIWFFFQYDRGASLFTMDWNNLPA